MENQEPAVVRVEDDLLRSKKRYERMANTVPVMLYDSVLDETGTSRFLYVAPEPCREILELDPEALLDDMNLVWSLVHPEDLERFRQEDLAANREGKAFSSEVRIITPSGRLKWLFVSSKPNPAEPGRPRVWSGFLQDITDRKQAEKEREQFFNFFQTSADLMCIADLDAFFIQTNPAFTRTLGYAAAELTGKPFIEFVHPDDRQKTIEEIEKQKQTGFTDDFENRYLCRDGSVKWLSWRVKYNETEQLAYATARDITEQKIREEERARLEAQLQQAQKMEAVGRLAGGVAHDFNNILSVILGHAEMAQQKSGTGPLGEHLEQIRKAAQRSSEIVSQLLAFARKQTVAPRKLDLNDTIENMLRMLRRLIGEAIELTWRPEPGVWPVRIDPVQIDQILANLCINARDAIADVGRITIETRNRTCTEAFCSGRRDITPGEYVQLTVGDDGCGMEPEVLENIFDPFFTTKGVSQGTGLGLATVYGIVKQNGGYIAVESEPGRGSRFEIYLPRHAGAAESEKPAELPESVEGGQETVLLVEDEPVILEVGQQMLEMLGYRVLAVGAPGAAIRLAKEQAGAIHLLLTDVIMPEMNGRQLAQTLCAFCPDLKCLFMSGYNADVIADHGVLEEGIHFLEKPFSFTALATKVREVLDGA